MHVTGNRNKLPSHLASICVLYALYQQQQVRGQVETFAWYIALCYRTQRTVANFSENHNQACFSILSDSDGRRRHSHTHTYLDKS